MLAQKLKLNMENGTSLRDAVYETLKDAILTGEMKPGERIMEIPIADQLGVSRTPVREALHRLQEENLVIIQPKCGAKVADITEKSVRDALAVRTTIEEMSVRLAARNHSADVVNKLREINTAIETAVREQDIETIFACDKNLHRVICDAADNPVLSSVTAFLDDLVLRYRIEYVKCIEDCGQLTVEHGELVDAIEAGNEELAVKLIREHISNQNDRICSMIRNKVEHRKL